MGRPCEFDREETLSKAMELFWERGYKATSIEDLVDRMGIKRGSIYNTFGDKHSLFIAAVEYYAKEVTSRTIKILESPGSPLENIKLFFETIVNTPSDKKKRGCLISNTVVELAPHDEKVADTVRIILERIQNAFLHCLDKAVELGELPEDTDTKVLSHFLATSTHGLIVTGKSAVDNKQMKDVVDVILSTLH
ncbi:MAG: TetR/AcrR family transcriptional regulator [Thermodesulfobacteriales bacterium]|nr:MAG: TetR/AcrR family transcriptional regulator [Thermodesulfobacteriales bacterium]